MSPPERTLGPIGWKGLFGSDDESDDERTADDEQPTDAVGTADDRGGPRERDERATRSGDTDRSRSGGGRGRDGSRSAGGDGRDRSRSGGGDGLTDRGGGTTDSPEPTAAAGRPDNSTELDEQVREERAKTSGELSGDHGAERDTPTTDADTGYVRTDTAGSTPEAIETADRTEDPAVDVEDDQSMQRADELPSSSAPADTGSRSGAASGAGTRSGDTSQIWVNPLDDRDDGDDGADGADGVHGADGTDVSTGRPSDWERGIVDASSAPPNDPRVRTARSDTHEGESGITDPEVTSAGPESTTGKPATTAGEPETTGDDAEYTLGPIGINGLPGREDDTEEGIVSKTEEPPVRRQSRSSGSTAGEREPALPVEASHTGTGEAEEASLTDRLTSRLPWSVSLTAIGVGVGLLVFLDIVSMMVPLIAAIGAGIVGGFVAGYISGGTVRGGLHALAVGIIGGIAVGYLTALIGALLGLFLEPATLLGSVIGPIAPELGIFGAWGPLLVMVFVTVMVAVDATIAGVVGGTVRSVVDEAR